MSVSSPGPIPEVSIQRMQPGDMADPRAGTLFGFTPDSWVRLYRDVGPVFRFAETGLTFLCGPEANAAAWKTPDDWSYAASRTGAMFISQFGADYITASDGDVHRRQRKLLRPAISRDALGRHVQGMLAELDGAFSELAAHGSEVDLHDALIVVYTRAFNRSTVVSGADAAMIDAIARFEEEMILGGSLHGAEQAAWYARPSYLALRAHVLGHFRRLVLRRLGGARADDSLDLVIDLMRTQGALSAVHADAELEELTRHAYLLQAGGAGNIASMVCNLLAELVLNPDWLRAVEAEVRIDPQVLAVRGVQDMPLLSALLQEAERRLAPTPIMPKVARRDLDFLGVAIPRGLEVLHLFGVANFLPEAYPEPMRFDPLRWQGGKARKPVAFGGGEHMCLGIDVARLYLLLSVVALLRSFRLECSGLPQYRRVDEGDPGSPLRLGWQVRISPRDADAPANASG
jgi:cytochrome P450